MAVFLRIITLTLPMLLMPVAAMATQAHGDPEGLYIHQMSHLFFILSMGILIYWLRLRKLIHEPGWRHIQFSAVFFILWSVDAFTAHCLDEQFQWVNVSRIAPWRIRLDASQDWLAGLYYLVKLDHLLCVPAMIFLYSGLKRLYLNTETGTPGDRRKENAS